MATMLADKNGGIGDSMEPTDTMCYDAAQRGMRGVGACGTTPVRVGAGVGG